jgi:hypothetical protein
MSISTVTYIGPYFIMPNGKIKVRAGMRTRCANGHTLARSYEGKFCSHCGTPVSVVAAYQMVDIGLTDFVQADNINAIADKFIEVKIHDSRYVLCKERSLGITYVYPEDNPTYNFYPNTITRATETMRGHMDPIFKWCDLHGIARPEIHYGVVVFYL